MLDMSEIAETDEEIVKKILSGQLVFQNKLYDRYNGKIYFKCLTVVKNKEIAKDLTHDIFIKIFTKLHSFSGKSDFSFWIYAVTYNTCMTHLRKNKNKSTLTLNNEIDIEDSSSEDTSGKILLDLRLDQLEQLLERMKPHHRLILLMRYQDGMSIKDISDTLKMNESAVKMRLKRSRERLAEQFKLLGDE